MTDIKQSISKGITALNLKTSNFVEVSKMKTCISTLLDDIASLKNQIGDKVYSNWTKEEPLHEGIWDMMEAIRQKYILIKEQEEEMKKLMDRERQILGSDAVKNVDVKKYCPKCGGENSMTHKFCGKCGATL